MTIIVAT